MSVILGIDPGSTTGLAVWDGERIALLTTIRLTDTDGAAEALRVLATIRPSRIIVEDPANVQRGSSTEARHVLQRRLGAILALCQIAYPGVPLELVNTATWQRWAHARQVAADPKDRSLGRLMEGPISPMALASLRGPRGGLRHDAADAGCVALWGALCKA